MPEEQALSEIATLAELDRVLAKAQRERWQDLALVGETDPRHLAHIAPEHRFVLLAPLLKQRLEALARLTDLTTLDLNYNYLGNDVFVVSKLPRLAALDLSFNGLREEGAAALSGFKNLTFLDLSYNQIGKEGAVALSTLKNLTSLVLDLSGMGREGAVDVSTLKNLTSLDISDNDLGDDEARKLTKLKKLTSLTINNNQIGDKGAIALASLEGLTFLDLSKNQVGNKGAIALAGLKNLTSLNLFQNQIGREGMEGLLEACSDGATKLQTLNLGRNRVRGRFVAARTLSSGKAQAILSAYRRYRDNAAGGVTTEDLIALLRRRLPASIPGGELALTEAKPPLWVDDGWLFVALRLVMREDGVVVDVREQEICLGRFDDHPPERWHAYIDGTLRSAAAILGSQGGAYAILPCDLFAHRLALRDRSLRDADAFAARLGDPDQLAIWNAMLDDQDWLALLKPCGLSRRLAEVKSLLRPSLRLRLSDDEGGEVGLTRLGGDPDLPPSQPWPEVAGEPLTFVAQLDLAELARHPEARELPREGLLSFFYAPIPPDGFGTRHPVAVLHLREIDALARRAAPEGCARLRSHRIDLEGERLFPALESSFHFENLRPEAAVLAFYRSLARQRASAPPIDSSALDHLILSRSECDFDRPAHRLLGHPASIQGDPYLDVEMALRGWEGWREGTREALEHRRRALGWRLLLQVDAYQDGELLLNQDGGFFYFWIPADALAARDFSRAVGCLQCH